MDVSPEVGFSQFVFGSHKSGGLCHHAECIMDVGDVCLSYCLFVCLSVSLSVTEISPLYQQNPQL